MSECVLSYAEAEELKADLFYYDHDLSELNAEKTPKLYSCLYCDAITQRSEPSLDHYLFVCQHCGWWQVIAGGGSFGYKSCEIHRGQLKRYPVGALDVPLKELREYLQRHPHHVALVNPTAFERLVADCLKDRYGPCEVLHVGGTADRGTDLILAQLEEGPRLIQVKRRADLTKPEGVQVVRALNGVLFRENVAKGMVITTASRFTKAAVSETKIWTPTGKTYDMKLLAYEDVVKLFDVKPKNPYHPWLAFLPPRNDKSGVVSTDFV